MEPPRENPDVRVEMLLTNEALDIIDKELDIALRIGALPDSTFVARSLEALYGPRFAPARLLVERAEGGQLFEQG